MTTQIHEQIKEAASFIQQQGVEQPEIGLILGSGLGELGDEIENPVIIPYHLIPHFPVSTVSGHAGQLVYGVLGEKKFWSCKGVSIIMKDTNWEK